MLNPKTGSKLEKFNSNVGKNGGFNLKNEVSQFFFSFSTDFQGLSQGHKGASVISFSRKFNAESKNGFKIGENQLTPGENGGFM